MIKRYIISFCSLLFCALIVKADNCPACKGTGRIVKNITTSNFGLGNDPKIKCQECGEWHLSSTGHHHINCPYCRGANKQNNRNRNSIKNEEYIKPEYVLSPEEEAIVRAMAQNSYDTQKFGIPIRDNEQQILDAFKVSDKDNYIKYMEWRNELNLYIIDYTKSANFGWAKYNSSASLDNIKKQRDNRLINLLNRFYAPQELKNIALQHLKSYEDAYNMCKTQSSLQEIQNSLDNMILQQNKLYFY